MTKKKNFISKMSDTNLLLSITICVFVVMYVFAMIAYGGGFLQVTNLFKDLNLVAPKLLVCISLTIVMINGSIDISVGGVIGLVTTICAIYLENQGGSLIGALVIALAIGLAFGVVQGWLIAYLEIQPFIVTLAGMFFARGLTTLISDVQINVRSNEGFSAFQKSVVKLPIGSSIRGNFIPAKMEPGLLIALVVLILVFVMLRWTKLGRAFYAVGGNAQSALMLGINAKRTKFIAHLLSSMIAGLAGFVFLSHFGNGAASNAMAYEMEAIAASIIGGTLLTGGVGNVIGTFFGVMILTTIRNIVTSAGLGDAWWTNITVAAMLCLFLVIQSIILKVRKNGASA